MHEEDIDLEIERVNGKGGKGGCQGARNGSLMLFVLEQETVHP